MGIEEHSDAYWLKVIGARFAAVRELAYLSVGDLAGLTGYPVETWKAVESGTHEMGLAEARAAAAVMGVSVDFLTALDRGELERSCADRMAGIA